MTAPTQVSSVCETYIEPSAIALYDYEPTTVDDLSFNVRDASHVVLNIHTQFTGEVFLWVWGRDRSRTFGVRDFQYNFQLLQNLRSAKFTECNSSFRIRQKLKVLDNLRAQTGKALWA